VSCRLAVHMLDIGHALAFVWGLVLAVRARSRLAVLAVLFVVYIFALEVVIGFGAKDRGSLNAAYAFMLTFIGPTGMPRGGSSAWPLSSLVVGHPVLTQLVTAGVLAGPRQLLAGRAAQLRPELEEARLFDRAALQLTLLIVIDLLVAVMLMCLQVWTRE
jgi:hypothetical protein